jgi:RNA polymerase sigma factor (sigma-70 family)
VGSVVERGGYPSYTRRLTGRPQPDHEEERVLFDAWRAGDRDAGTRLVRRYVPSVYAFFDSRLPGQAEDLAQRTFLACVEQHAHFRGDATFRAYLFGIARKQMLKVLEKAAIVQRNQGAAPPPPLRTSPSGAVARREEQELLLRGLRALPVELQIMLQLYYWERMGTEEIASVMETSRGAIKLRLHRARDRLRDTIAGLDASEALRTQTLDDLEHWAASLRASSEPDPGG